MSTYKELFGKYVQSLATDPTTAAAVGQIWYNTTSNTFKTILASGAWVSGNPLLTAVNQSFTFGTQTDAVSAGGAAGYKSTAEKYNGTSWSAGNTITARKSGGSAGTGTAGVIFTGQKAAMGAPFPTSSNATEEYDGTNWTTTGLYPVPKQGCGSGGTQIAALGAGGYIVPADPGSPTNTSEEYNGSSWAAGGTLSLARLESAAGVVGTQTAGLLVGGRGPPFTGAVEEYNGSSWTSVTAVPQAIRAGGGAGPQIAAVVFGGQISGTPDIQTATFSYDGTSWSAAGNLGTGRYLLGGAGTQTSALAIGGSTASARQTLTEEYAPSSTVVVPAGWASGGNLNTARDSLMTAAQAPQNAAFVFGGHAGPTVTDSESYDGTCWTATNALPVSKQLGGGAGTQGAALCFAGQTAPPAVNKSTTESWDGSNWTAVAAPGGTLATARLNGGSAGVQGAALLFGGGPPTTATSEEWNGSTWSPGGSLSRGTTGADNVCGAGIQTSALAMGGTAPSFVYNTTEEYNGTSWTGGGGLNTARRRAAAAASTVDAGLCFGGLASPGSGQTAASELYDGTSWTNTASMGTARYYLGGSGATQGDGFAMGGLLTGSASNYTNATEEFTAPGTALNYKTLTTS